MHIFLLNRDHFNFYAANVIFVTNFHNQLYIMLNCTHTNNLQRKRRTLWQRLLGIKEVYICKECGHVIKIK
ncbi:hypothetical protein FXE99_10140 [Vibrio mimicus]|nr:hypothetical protein FXE99_10140 [Vibrio mimicus]